MKDVKIAYATHVIEVSNIPTFLNFYKRTPRQCFQAIRYLHLGFSIDLEQILSGQRIGKKQSQSMEAWNRACSIIAGMKGLEMLQVYVSKTPMGLYHITDADEERILKPLRMIQQTTSFEVIVGWFLADFERGMQNTPFTSLEHNLF